MLVNFWTSRKHDRAIAERDLNAWYKLAKAADWDTWAVLKQTFGSADRVGNCTVFDVGNNRYRLIGRVMYEAKIVYVLSVMDHAEYDKREDGKQKWISDCGCNDPPPK